MTSPRVLLPGFEYRRIDVEGVTISCAVRGAGPPVLMLHGYPQNHLAWRHVGPALAEDHTVVLADLRGYGDSGKPDPDTAGLVYSKRTMARDQVGLMRRLGFGSFQLVGHDRGARTGHRLVLDHPDAVTRFAVLDIVPTQHALRHLTLPSVTLRSVGHLAGVCTRCPRRGGAHRPLRARRGARPARCRPARFP